MNFNIQETNQPHKIHEGQFRESREASVGSARTVVLASYFDARSSVAKLSSRGAVAGRDGLIAIDRCHAASRFVTCSFWHGNRRLGGSNGCAATRNHCRATSSVAASHQWCTAAMSATSTASAEAIATAKVTAVMLVHVAAMRILRIARPQMVDAWRRVIAIANLIGACAGSNFGPHVLMSRESYGVSPIRWIGGLNRCAMNNHDERGDQHSLPLHVVVSLGGRPRAWVVSSTTARRNRSTAEYPNRPLIEARRIWGAHYCRLPQRCTRPSVWQTKLFFFRSSEQVVVLLLLILRNVATLVASSPHIFAHLPFSALRSGGTMVAS